jgi:hypothetical protein
MPQKPLTLVVNILQLKVVPLFKHKLHHHFRISFVFWVYCVKNMLKFEKNRQTVLSSHTFLSFFISKRLRRLETGHNPRRPDRIQSEN